MAIKSSECVTNRLQRRVLQAEASHQSGFRLAQEEEPDRKREFNKRSSRTLMLTLTVGLRGCRRPVRGSRAGVRALGVLPTGSYIE